jgi:hypothetical protein
VEDILSHGAVCKQRPEVCLIFGYMELCVVRDCGRHLVT